MWCVNTLCLVLASCIWIGRLLYTEINCIAISGNRLLHKNGNYFCITDVAKNGNKYIAKNGNYFCITDVAKNGNKCIAKNGNKGSIC